MSRYIKVGSKWHFYTILSYWLLLSSMLPDSGELRPAAISEFMGLAIYSP